jgi:hypothetical protein
MDGKDSVGERRAGVATYPSAALSWSNFLLSIGLGLRFWGLTALVWCRHLDLDAFLMRVDLVSKSSTLHSGWSRHQWPSSTHLDVKKLCDRIDCIQRLRRMQDGIKRKSSRIIRVMRTESTTSSCGSSPTKQPTNPPLDL